MADREGIEPPEVGFGIQPAPSARPSCIFYRMLSDNEIRFALGTHKTYYMHIGIDPIDADKQVQPASVDLRLGNEFMSYPDEPQTVSIKERKLRMVKHTEKEFYELKPGGFVLGTTIERVTLGPAVAGKVEGKSSLGRIGLMTHVTAGFIDPGFDGQITLELRNVTNNVTIQLVPGAFVCQIAFTELSSAAARPYGSKGLNSRYQHQESVQAAK